MAALPPRPEIAVLLDGELLQFKIPHYRDKKTQVLYSLRIQTEELSTKKYPPPGTTLTRITLETRFRIDNRVSKITLLKNKIIGKVFDCVFDNAIFEPDLGPTIGYDQVPSGTIPKIYFEFEVKEGHWFTELITWSSL